jgi:hypothetical protein
VPDITPNTAAKYAKKGMIGNKAITAAGDAERRINVLIYGDSGIGKTVLAGSAADVPEMRDVLVIDAEGGTESLVRTYPSVDVVRITNMKEIWPIYDELHRGSHPYGTVVLDSLSELQKYDLYEILEIGSTERPGKVDPDVAGIREWGVTLEHMRRTVRLFRDLPCNTIFTALVNYMKDPRTGMYIKNPGLQGRAAAELPAFPDIVLYYFSKEVKQVVDGEEVTVEKRIAQSKRTSTVAAKDRTGLLPAAMRDPTMQKIWTAVTTTNTETNTENEETNSDAA